MAQLIVCLVIVTTVSFGKNVNNKTINVIIDKGKDQVMKEVSISDLRGITHKAINVLKDTPSQIVSAVISANENSQYGEPIDEKSDDEIKQVHAVAGGMVLCSGVDKEMGMYIKIQHENAVSIYGNLKDINVLESERVKRGEIIGSYDTKMCIRDSSKAAAALNWAVAEMTDRYKKFADQGVRDLESYNEYVIANDEADLRCV